MDDIDQLGHQRRTDSQLRRELLVNTCIYLQQRQEWLPGRRSGTVSLSSCCRHGRRSLGTERTSPTEFGVGDANANYPPYFVIYFKISITRLLASQCNKKLTNPITVTAYSLLPKSESSVSTKSPLQAENSTFFLTGAGKNAAQNSSKRAISRELFFLRRGLKPLPRPLLRWCWVPDIGTPHPSPSNLDQSLHPQNSSQIYATGCQSSASSIFAYIFWLIGDV